ncbi:MAG: hypothetical protein GX942_07085 [Papillibacter sp.]|nr:hypothetical protein [Papillibacter sp.]
MVYVSALKGIGLHKLLALIEKHAALKSKTVEMLIPYGEGSVISEIYKKANEVIEEQYRENGIYIKAEVDETSSAKLQKYFIR